VPWHWDQYACFVNCEHCKEILLHVHAAFVKKWWTFCQSCKHALFFMLVWIFSYIETLAPILRLSDWEELLALTTDFANPKLIVIHFLEGQWSCVHFYSLRKEHLCQCKVISVNPGFIADQGL
jgi:hypothetical protein